MEDNTGAMAERWAKLKLAQSLNTKTVVCPKVSEILGEEYKVTVRAIDAKDLLNVGDFPIGEINELVARDAKADEYTTAWKEHVESLDVDDLLVMIERTVEIALVDPDPNDPEADVSLLKGDYETIYKAVLEMSIPKGDAETAATFHK